MCAFLEPCATVIVGKKGEQLSEPLAELQSELRQRGYAVQIARWPDELPDGTGPAQFLGTGAGDESDLVALVAGKTVSTPLKAINLADVFCKDLEPVPWILEGWMARREVICLAGESSVGKSMLAMQLALCLVSGRKFLGEIEVQGAPYRVLYVDEENNARLVEHRLRKVARGLEIKLGDLVNDRLMYVSGNDLNFDNGSNLDAFRKTVAGFRPDVIVLDSLVRFHGQEENSNMAMASFFSRVIKKTAIDYDAGFVILHHLSKPSKERGASISLRLRGASDLRAQIDGLWGMTADEGGRVQLLHEKCRWDEPSPPIKLKFESDDGDSALRFVIEEDTDSIESALLAVINSKGADGATTQDLVQVFENLGMTSGERLVRKYCARLSGDGRISKSKQGRECRYHLADSAELDAA
jgi:ABC-type dipeptide/oligopeptide/nickel transport system ATPase component